MYKRSFGFTLIELLVVVAIISLLSSVVLAAVRDAREKAKAKAFRVEINELVKALELYRSDNGRYPSQGATQFVHSRSSDGSYSNSGTSGVVASIQTALSPYIPNMPLPTVSGAMITYSWRTGMQCAGDASAGTSPYYILVSATQPGVENWPVYVYLGTPNTSFKCYSLK